MPTRSLIDGYRKFREKYESDHEVFDRLADEGQDPKVIWIGCSDSRVVPELITGADPGRTLRSAEYRQHCPAGKLGRLRHRRRGRVCGDPPRRSNTSSSAATPNAAGSPPRRPTRSGEAAAHRFVARTRTTGARESARLRCRRGGPIPRDHQDQCAPAVRQSADLSMCGRRRARRNAEDPRLALRPPHRHHQGLRSGIGRVGAHGSPLPAQRGDRRRPARAS